MATMTLAVTDWNESQRAELPEVPDDLEVAQLIDEVREALGLPADTPYSLIHEGQKLNYADTLSESGVRSGEELTIAPEVSAG